MGKKIVCESCGTIFPFEKAKDMTECPVCGATFDEDEPTSKEPLSFGEGIELGPYDSFDEDKIDFWWYKISEPGTYGETDVGHVYTNCAKCGHFVNSAPYPPIAQTGNYLLVDSAFYGKCTHCGHELKNHILSKRPADWVDPRKQKPSFEEEKNVPRCPTCSSTNIRKLSVTSKVVDVAMWGVLSRKAHKQWHCDNCGSEW